MNQLIDEQVIFDVVKNWEYPKHPVDTEQIPDKSGDDLPDAMRWADAILEAPKWCDLKGADLANFLENWTYETS